MIFFYQSIVVTIHKFDMRIVWYDFENSESLEF
jgi:hypothetical protein